MSRISSANPPKGGYSILKYFRILQEIKKQRDNGGISNMLQTCNGFLSLPQLCSLLDLRSIPGHHGRPCDVFENLSRLHALLRRGRGEQHEQALNDMLDQFRLYPASIHF